MLGGRGGKGREETTGCSSPKMHIQSVHVEHNKNCLYHSLSYPHLVLMSTCRKCIAVVPEHGCHR